MCQSVCRNRIEFIQALFKDLSRESSVNDHYEVYYYYGKDFSDVKGEFGFPYYIVFSDSVLLLSVDGTVAMVSDEESVYQYFSNMFQSFLSNTMPLVTSNIMVDIILSHFMEMEKEGNDRTIG